MQTTSHTMPGLQERLFADVPPPPRPKFYGEETLDVLTESIWKRVVKWMTLDGSPPPDGSYAEESKESLRKCIDYEDRAYRILRNLESDGWDVDDPYLQDIAGMVDVDRHKAHKEVIKAWVLRNGVKADLAVGQIVSFKHVDGRKRRGEVMRVDAETASYLVFCEDLGHVREGNGTRGFHINAEDVEALET